MILALKTDSDPVEIYLLDEVGEKVLREKKWRAERTLAKNLLNEIQILLGGNFKQLTGLIIFSGPGSFTGLRIATAVVNTIAYSEGISVVGVDGDDWLKDGAKKLSNGENDKIVVPNYGRDANITKPKK